MFKSRRKKKSKGELEPGNSTFTLRIDDQSNLVGFNIKKPKPQVESKHRRFLPFKRGFSKESEDEKTTEESGIKGKIKGIFSRIKIKSIWRRRRFKDIKYIRQNQRYFFKKLKKQ
ncbi:hypothetical protein MBGDF03_00782 [Thermoplasmatales archaeon SCGC AB-540-F20]|nr:hypothetical protein MBGDF03_00782 [Thermoplasmatales archaeon SCGC AB-540-F20]